MTETPSEPGRTLDALVSTEVFGWDAQLNTRCPHRSGCPCRGEDYEHWTGGDMVRTRVPDYSTNESDALCAAEYFCREHRGLSFMMEVGWEFPPPPPADDYVGWSVKASVLARFVRRDEANGTTPIQFVVGVGRLVGHKGLCSIAFAICLALLDAKRNLK